jgi:Fur family peroxide stress response transcriptional regulator
MKNERRSAIESVLRGARLNVTPQRYAVLEHLQNRQGHPTAEEIRTDLNRRFPRVSRATVYNTLNTLRDAGLVRELFLGDDGVARYDPIRALHHHFICIRCGSLRDLPFAAFAELPLQLPPGYRVERWEVVLRGRCPACRTARSSQELKRGDRRS